MQEGYPARSDDNDDIALVSSDRPSKSYVPQMFKRSANPTDGESVEQPKIDLVGLVERRIVARPRNKMFPISGTSYDGYCDSESDSIESGELPQLEKQNYFWCNLTIINF